MTALHIHRNALLTVLRTSAGLDSSVTAPADLRDALVARLQSSNPLLADRVSRLDDWHTDALAQLVADAHALALALEGPSADDQSLQLEFAGDRLI